MYTGLGAHTTHFYNHVAQFTCHRDGDTMVLRRPVLEEFHTNRTTRKWNLCVSGSIIILLNFV
jgi:hypothetical protein